MFKKIFVEITNRCNLACDFCPATRRPKADMAPVAFATLLPQLAPFTRHLSLHVLGEPLLHPDLPRLLALYHEHKMLVNLTSNGTLLPRHGPMLLAAPALRQINISLHSVTGRHSGFDPEGYLTGVLDFAGLAAARGIFVSLRIWNLPSEPPTAESDLQGDLLSRLEKVFGLEAPLAPAVVSGQGVKLAERIFLSQKQLFSWPTMASPDLGGTGTCRGLRDQVAILVDGTVVPCCLDAEGQIPLGNIFRQPFREIVNSGRALRISKGFREHKVVEPLCRRCSYRQRF